MGGSNQSLFLMAALFVGQGDIMGQGSAAVPLLIFGLLLSWSAAPGWTELILMWPNRVGGIAATCGEAFRPYAPVLGNLAGTCYWWGWVPTCGLTAILSASAIHEWYLPGVPIEVMACALVVFFAAVNLCGVKWVARTVVPIAAGSAALAFLSGLSVRLRRALRGRRHGRRRRRKRREPPVLAVHAGRRVDDSQVRRHRTRTRDHQAVGRADARRDRRPQRRWPRIGVLVHAAGVL
jgi:hypothetical protein